MNTNIFPYSIIKYNDYFIKKNANIESLDDFFFNIITLIEPEEDNDITEYIQDILEEIEFNSIEETDEFLSKYFEYTNSIISYFNKLEKINDEDKRINLITDIYKVFLNIYDQDFKAILSIIYSNAIDVIEVIFEKYRIMTDTIDEEIIKVLSSEIGEENTNRILYLFDFFQDIRNTPEKFDKTIAGAVFNNVINLILHMNMLRKKELSGIRKVKKTIKAPGRNDPCPCGSGRKYKKCCLNKDEK